MVFGEELEFLVQATVIDIRRHCANHRPMRGRLYSITRDLHLYIGLFISPFILLFSVTVFFFVHAWLPRFGSETSQTRVVNEFALPANWSSLSGRTLIDALKPALQKAGLPGEVGFIRHITSPESLIIPVTVPGRETTVTVNIAKSEATILTREAGLAAALVTLHKSPGQHGGDIRMNWFFMKAWRWLADATVYLTLFITASGLYLWFVLRAERRVGTLLLCGGALCFFAMAYALSH